MDNYINILALGEQAVRNVVFVSHREEAGFGLEYDPLENKFSYRVFIHKTLPYRETASWNFESFSAARGFAADKFRTDWQMMVWDGQVRRKCGSGDGGCGTGGGCSSGSCGTSKGGGCGSSGGGCSTGNCKIED